MLQLYRTYVIIIQFLQLNKVQTFKNYIIDYNSKYWPLLALNYRYKKG